MKKIILLSLTFLATVGSIQSKADSGQLPDGYYKYSCTGCSYNAKTKRLQCQCPNPKGYSVPSSIKVQGSGCIFNTDGNLSYQGMPTGGYKKSCKNCSYNAKTKKLQCQCRTSGGKYKNSSIKITGAGDIACYKGNLAYYTTSTIDTHIEE